jgi:aryl-alcohol dehydrogenase-like predicted oxidoreductase
VTPDVPVRRNSRGRATPSVRSATPEPEAPAASTGWGDGLPLGKTGRVHPPIGLGLWGLGRWRPEEEARTKATLGRAIERGLRWFDTAEVYGAGRSERLLGDVLRRAGASASDAFVVTKVSWEHLKPDQVRPALLGSLQRLGRRSVDLYLVHAPSPRTPIADTMRALEVLWKEQRVGAIGVSNFSVEELREARAALRETDVVANQVLYNLFEREDGDAVREYCRSEGIVVEAYTPLARGLLAGRYLTEEHPRAAELGGVLARERFPEFQRRARSLHAFASKQGVSLASLALQWLRRRGAAPIVGASRPDQVDQIYEAWRRPIGEDVLERADAIAQGHGD